MLTPSDLIWPLFVTEGDGVEEPIATLPADKGAEAVAAELARWVT